MKNLKGVLFFGTIFVIIDQAIKILVSEKMIINQTNIIIKDFFSLRLTHNAGAAFSLFTGHTLLLSIIGIAALLAVLVYIKNQPVINDFDIFTYSLLIGGIAGNLVDRIVHGYVIDYLSFKFGSYYFPIFNFADVCIVLSVVIIIFTTLKGDLWK